MYCNGCSLSLKVSKVDVCWSTVLLHCCCSIIMDYIAMVILWVDVHRSTVLLYGCGSFIMDYSVKVVPCARELCLRLLCVGQQSCFTVTAAG